MELTVIKEKIPRYFKKYKFPILILIVGVLMMLMPTHQRNPASNQNTEIEVKEYSQEEENLQRILSKIQGAGRVEVLLTKAVDSEIQYQENGNYSSGDSGENNASTTVIITDSSRNESGLVQKRIAPVYRGAVVVCDGADDPTVRLSMVNAVSKVTGLGTNHISVFKMQ